MARAVSSLGLCIFPASLSHPCCLFRRSIAPLPGQFSDL